MIKNLTLVLCISTLLISCGASKKTVTKRKTYNKKTVVRKKSVSNKKTVVTKNEQVSVADKIIWSAVSYKGTPYKYGGVTKSGMDCSGLIHTSFKERNIVMPRSSGLLYKEGYKIPLSKAKRGDLLFFKTTNKSRSKINHVAIVTSSNNGVVKFIHSTSSRGVIESSMLQDYWRKSFIEAKRVL